MKGQRLLLACTLFQFMLFVPLAWWARRHPQPPLELAVTHAVQHKRSRVWQHSVQALSMMVGSPLILMMLVICTALRLWKRQWRFEALITVGVFCSNALARALIKQLVHRPRPSPFLIEMSDHKKTSSFPSGHVCSAMSYWGWLAALCLLRGTTPWHTGVAVVALLCLLCVGPSRIYLGDHWATDVLGGYLFAGGWLGFFLLLYPLFSRRPVS